MRRWLIKTLINENYALFTLGTAASGIGYWFLFVAIGWLVLELSNSTFLLGLASFAQMAPMFVLGLFGGLAADRFNRKTIMTVMQGVVITATGVLAVCSSLGIISIPIILLCSLVFGIANSVLWPTWSVFIKDLVGTANLRRAVALNSTRFNLTRVIGPALAGILLRDLGPGWCLWIGFISSLGIIATIALIRLPAWQPPPPANTSVLKAVGEGLQQAWRTPSVRRTLAVAGAFGTIAMPFQTFLPAVARDSLQAGPEVLGWLTAAVGVGAMVGALGSGSRLATAHPERTLVALAVGVAVGLGLLALANTLWLALLALALLGLASIAFLSIANVSVQLGVPEALVGRVMGLWVVLNAGTQPIGSLIEGAIAERWGLGVTFSLAALLCGVVVIALVVTRQPTSRRATPLGPEAADR